jgi:prepilin-type N-terminal cleavage/methylation domain-containing protein
MMNATNKKRKGFSLVELIVVISIMLVLSVLAVVAFTNISDSAREAAERADANAVARSLNTFNTLAIADTNKYITVTAIPTADGNTYVIVHTTTTGVMPITLSVTVADAARMTEVNKWLVAPANAQGIWTVAATKPTT